jgi:hypothetical protein
MSDPIVEVHYVKGGSTNYSNNVKTVSISHVFYKNRKNYSDSKFSKIKYTVNEMMSNTIPYHNRNYFIPHNPNMKNMEGNPASGFVRNGPFDRYIYESSILILP